jgi:hypothetical protein
MSKIQLPEHQPDGAVRMSDYYELDDVANKMLPVTVTTIRRRLVDGRWHGARFGGRWYMSLDDVADAVAEARGEGTYRLTEYAEPPQLGVPLDDETGDDLGGVR